MKLQFATCNRKTALGFLQKLYPDNTITDTDNSAKDILDLVEADIVRIPDPYFHGPAVAIFPSKNWDETKRTEYTTTLKDFHRKALKESGAPE